MADQGLTDIIVTTRNRVGYLKQTLSHITQRTRSPYSLHVIDDGSDDGETPGYLFGEYQAGRIQHLYLRGQHVGPMGNLNLGAWAAFSDPVVFVDDDVLCPSVQPDWLARGLAALEKRPKLGMLALRHPGAKVKPVQADGDVTIVQSVGGTFLFCRRAFLLEHPLPHERGLMEWPQQRRCQMAHEAGWKIGVLTETFCYHIGQVSALNDKPYPGRFVDVKDWKTLEPVKRYW